MTVFHATGTTRRAALTIIAVLAFGVLPSDEDASGATAYPQRIGHQWLVRDLLDRTGPAAGLIRVGQDWNVVSEGGRRWQLPTAPTADAHPTISPDGRYVGYLAAAEGPYVIHDLNTGDRTRFPEVGSGLMRDGVPIADAEYHVYDQSPSFWSPTSRQVLIAGDTAGAARGDDVKSQLLLDVDGSVSHLEADLGEAGAMPSGWVNDDTLVWTAGRRGKPADTDAPYDEVVALFTSLRGEVEATVSLQPAAQWEATILNQWSSVVHPDGSELLVLGENRRTDGIVHRFSLTDGKAMAEPVDVPDVASPCGPGWAGSQPAVPVYSRDSRDATTAVVDGDDAYPVVAVEPGLGSRCIVWADDALGGGARGGVLGTATAWWTWWWQEALAVLLLAAVGVATWRWRVGQQGPGPRTG